MNTIRKVFIFFVFLFVIPTIVYALPITLDLTKDSTFDGRAVLSGDLDDTTFTNNYWIKAVTGENWWMEVILFTSTIENVTEYNLYSYGRHITKKEDLHSGETSPGLKLGGLDKTFHNNLNGVNPETFMDPGPQNTFDILIHPGSIDHSDLLFSHIDDLNGNTTLGFLTNDNQISARFELRHPVPEPSTLLLMCFGIVGIFGHARKRLLGKKLSQIFA